MESSKNMKMDPRKMRRIIAEDPEWNLETVSPLTELCIQHLVRSFNERPVLKELLPKHQTLLLSILPTKTPISITGPLIEEETFWERCCKTRWDLCDVSCYDNCWKRMYFERHLEDTLEKFVPPDLSSSMHGDSMKEILALLDLCNPFVKRLDIKQLLPNDRMGGTAEEEDTESLSELSATHKVKDHLDIQYLTKHMSNLEELCVCYRVKNCGMNFEWMLFQFTPTDCKNLCQAVKSSKCLQTLRLHHSQVSDDQARQLISYLLDHPVLKELELSHNKLGDGAGRALSKLLNGHSNLHTLDVSNNCIGGQGGIAIGHALANNTHLVCLNLRLNRLGDEGGQAIIKNMIKNKTLYTLNLASNDITESTAAVLSEMLILNTTLTGLILSCNKIGEAGGRALQEGMEENKTMLQLDLRLTDISQENEYYINQVIKNNNDAVKNNNDALKTAAINKRS
ncbi:dynein regulatory complex subunit 5-like [Dysidea avara]|uniref:dynein regulatory complex subunit 5-like n=1 Tax=Dysidea avara TaxID=196820 RepID=UPI00332CEFF7